jgi:hypothetical protein
VVVTLDPASGQGGCPAADYTVAAVVSTNGGAGTLAYTWELPDGRTSAKSVPIGEGQRQANLSLDFRLSGPPVSGTPALVITAPEESRTEGPQLQFRC